MELGPILAAAAASSTAAHDGCGGRGALRGGTPPTNLAAAAATADPIRPADLGAAQAHAAGLVRWAGTVRRALHAAVDDALQGDRLVPGMLARHTRSVELWRAAAAVLTAPQAGHHKDERAERWMATALASGETGGAAFATVAEAKMVGRLFWKAS